MTVMTDLEMRDAFLAAGVRLYDLPACVRAVHALTETGYLTRDTAARVICKSVEDFHHSNDD